MSCEWHNTLYFVIMRQRLFRYGNLNVASTLCTIRSYWRHFEADRLLMFPWKRNLEADLWNMTWLCVTNHHVLRLEYLYILTGPQPAYDILENKRYDASNTCVCLCRSLKLLTAGHSDFVAILLKTDNMILSNFRCNQEKCLANYTYSWTKSKVWITFTIKWIAPIL